MSKSQGIIIISVNTIHIELQRRLITGGGGAFTSPLFFAVHTMNYLTLECICTVEEKCMYRAAFKVELPLPNPERLLIIIYIFFAPLLL